MRALLLSAVLLTATMTYAPATLADDARVERLERDLQMLQKEIYRGGKVPAGNVVVAGGNDAARASVQVTALEERIRMLEGRLEQSEFENRKLSEQLDIFQKDVELRFNDLRAGGAMAPIATTDDKPITPTAAAASAATAQTESLPTPKEDQTLKTPAQKAAATGADGKSTFASPRDEYNNAFHLLTQTQYDQAGSAFESFIKNNPKDPLVGNAYYWAGETHYVRQNFIQAADYFRQGYESSATGPKAGDNLLKLAMSLSAIDRKTEACVVLKQVSAKFGANSITLKKKSEEERTRLGCK